MEHPVTDSERGTGAGTEPEVELGRMRQEPGSVVSNG